VNRGKGEGAKRGEILGVKRDSALRLPLNSCSGKPNEFEFLVVFNYIRAT
jgi:hypothetical protein